MTAAPVVTPSCCSVGRSKGVWCRYVLKWQAACQPRAPAEIPGGQGAAVLDGDVQVLTVTAEDVSAQFIAGAQQALELVRRHGIRVAVLKAGSPSCGNRLIYDGTFSGVKVAGEGVTTALLRRAGVQVFSELELEQAEQALAGLSV